MLSRTKKPPIGIEPREIHDNRRLDELVSAIYRYTRVGIKVPIEWIEEYNELVSKYQYEFIITL